MTLSKFPLSSKEILAQEKKSLELIRDCTMLSRLSTNIKDDAISAISNIDAISKKKIETGTQLLNFESFLNFEIEGKPCRIYFGGLVSTQMADCSTASYYLAVCKVGKKEKLRLLRKFHFDFDAGHTQTQDKKPFYHIQYAGKVTPLMLAHGIGAEANQKMDAWLSSPRITYMPISLITLLGIILKEFSPEKAEQLFTNDYWKGHLRKCEKALLESFHKNCSDILRDNKSLLLDICYH